MKMFSMFTFTYKCDQTFSLMKVNKLYLKVWTRDEHSAVVLSTAQPKFKLHQIVGNLSGTVIICIYLSQ
jgi:hypothetical protein